MSILPTNDWDGLGPRQIAINPLASPGTITLIGAVVGMQVSVTDLVTGLDVTSAFETSISVANQLQQSGTVPNNDPVIVTMTSTAWG